MFEVNLASIKCNKKTQREEKLLSTASLGNWELGRCLSAGVGLQEEKLIGFFELPGAVSTSCSPSMAPGLDPSNPVPARYCCSLSLFYHTSVCFGHTCTKINAGILFYSILKITPTAIMRWQSTWKLEEDRSIDITACLHQAVGDRWMNGQ